jgi:glycosyltransferase involved in cell wall biosynthesis
MRVVLDFQACQSSSRFRGIGRYSMSFIQKLVPQLMARGHEVIIALSNVFPEEAKQIKELFSYKFPAVKFVDFYVLNNSSACKPENQWRQIASRLLREHALACLSPDVLHVSTVLADGWDDDTIASVGALGIHIPTVLTHYDLIPFAMSDIYLSNPEFRDYYFDKLESVRNADLLLAISEYSKNEVLNFLKLPVSSVVSISSAVNEDFFESVKFLKESKFVLDKFGIEPGFLLYAPGGFDPRKNLDKLLEAYALLPVEIREKHKLVIASKLPVGYADGIVWKAGTFGIDSSQLILTDYVSDAELAGLYSTCQAYVFPSLHEGFGLPVLEAMLCGAAVIASNCTSIPEAHGLEDALFDPNVPSSISDKLYTVLTDLKYREKLINHALNQVGKFTWEKTANVALTAMESLNINFCKLNSELDKKNKLPTCEIMLEKISALNLPVAPSEADEVNFRACYMKNLELV